MEHSESENIKDFEKSSFSLTTSAPGTRVFLHENKYVCSPMLPQKKKQKKLLLSGETNAIILGNSSNCALSSKGTHETIRYHPRELMELFYGNHFCIIYDTI